MDDNLDKWGQIGATLSSLSSIFTKDNSDEGVRFDCSTVRAVFSPMQFECVQQLDRLSWTLAFSWTEVRTKTLRQ